MSEATFAAIVSQMAVRDDARLVLGGFGDPLMHPDWAKFLRIARQADIFALAVRTPASQLDEASIEQIVTAGVDVVNVLLDAHTPEMYAALHGTDAFSRILRNVDLLLQAARRSENAGVPLVVCEMLKTRQTLPEMEGFYDHWLSKGCGAVIAGPSHYAGQWADLAVMDMSPPSRAACQRLFSRCMVLADGTVTLCDQDFKASQVMGRLDQHSLTQIWQGEAFHLIRAHHLNRRWATPSLCAQCNEWHRP
jgi:spiro-SPASM protein